MSRGTTTLEPVSEKLLALGLDHPGGCLPELVEEATREKLAPVAFLDLILTRQLEHKDEGGPAKPRPMITGAHVQHRFALSPARMARCSVPDLGSASRRTRAQLSRFESVKGHAPA